MKQVITLKLGEFPKWELAKFEISQIGDRRLLVAMVTNLSRVVYNQNQ